jgi:coatomer subunit beta
MLLDGNFFVATALASSLTKLSLKYSSLEGPTQAEKNRLNAQCMLFMSSIVNLGKSGLPTTPMDLDSNDRIMACLRVLSDPTPELQKIFQSSCHEV